MSGWIVRVLKDYFGIMVFIFICCLAVGTSGPSVFNLRDQQLIWRFFCRWQLLKLSFLSERLLSVYEIQCQIQILRFLHEPATPAWKSFVPWSVRHFPHFAVCTVVSWDLLTVSGLCPSKHKAQLRCHNVAKVHYLISLQMYKTCHSPETDFPP